MKYTCRWASKGESGYIVDTDEGLYLTPFEVESILNQEPAEASGTFNVIHKNGAHLIRIWEGFYWSTFLHEGNIMFMDNPTEVGTIATLPDGGRVKIIGVGTEHSLKGETPQLAVFVKPWPEIGLDGFIKD